MSRLCGLDEDLSNRIFDSHKSDIGSWRHQRGYGLIIQFEDSIDNLLLSSLDHSSSLALLNKTLDILL